MRPPRRAVLGWIASSALSAAGCAGAPRRATPAPGRPLAVAAEPSPEVEPSLATELRPDGPPAEGPPEATAGGAASPRGPALDLPARPPEAETGSAFLARTEGLGRGALDDAIAAAILGGNVPSFLRLLAPVELRGPRGEVAELHVACDYLAVGSDDDFVRIPMTSAAAQRIADRLGCSLPTPRIVDAIYGAAAARLHPSWIDGGPTDGTLADTAFHHEKLEARRARAGAPLGALLAGHKKDIVLCARLAEEEDRVAIYGWHRREGDPIQPLSLLHSCRYADYSHGVRLVDQAVRIDGVAHRLSDVLRDPRLAGLLSEEGPLEVVAYARRLPSYEETLANRKKRRSRS